jgi:hypothetical protein
MDWFLGLFGLPPVAHQTALHIDLATLCIAVVAGVFSIYTFFHQRDVKATRITGIELQRDRLLITWIQQAIETVVAIEFLLRRWMPAADSAKFLVERDEHLGKLATVIDKGQFYFPNFEIIAVDENEPLPGGAQASLLGDLAAIYKLTHEVELDSAKMKLTRSELLHKKLNFIRLAQNEVDITNIIRSKRIK